MLLLIHGYPDNAYSWEHQIPILPTGISRHCALYPWIFTHKTKVGSYFDRGTLANDMAELIRVLNDGEPAYLVGQDWGAAIGYGRPWGLS